MHRSTPPVLALTVLSFSAGCDDPTDVRDSPTTVEGPTVSMELTVGDFLTAVGVPGLDVCVLNSSHCATTDATGTATLTVPADTEVPVTIEGGGYTPTLLPYRTTSDDLVVSVFLAPLTLLEAVFEDFDLDTSQGQITVTLVDGQDYSGTLDSGDSVLYWNELGTSIDPALSSTSASGRLAALNLAGATVTLTLDGVGSCVPLVHYSSTVPNEVVLPLAPRFFTGVTLDCG